MTPAEREALLKLWEDCSDTKPKELDCFGGKWEVSVEPGDKGSLQTIHDDYAAAIARDAMVIWLAQRFCGLFKTNELNGWAVWEEQDFGIRENVSEAETALLALIAACRKLTGKDSA